MRWWWLLLVACRRDAAVDPAVVRVEAGAEARAEPDAGPKPEVDASTGAKADAGAAPDRARVAALAKKVHGIVGLSNGHERVVVADDAERPVLVASFTKLFVAIATLRLVGRGVFGLDDTVKTLLPGLPARAWSDSTVRELLTHTSRVPEFDEGGGYYRRSGVDFHAPTATLGRELSSATEKRGVWKYRNAEFALLGAILQEQGKKPAAEILAEEVFRPAGMKHAGILVDRGPAELDLAPMGAIRPQNFFTAGNGYASLVDLLAFFDALGADTLLSKESKAMLFAGTADRHDGALGCWAYPFSGHLLVERPGGFGNVRLVTAFFPEERRAIVAWSKEAPDLGRPSNSKSVAAALARLALE